MRRCSHIPLIAIFLILCLRPILTPTPPGKSFSSFTSVVEKETTESEEGDHINSTRSVDWSQWASSAITVDGDPSDWSSYTPHPVGLGGEDIDLYLANDHNYVYICAEAKSDTTGEVSVEDEIMVLFDGDNDNDAVPQIDNDTVNTSTQDNWISVCGDPSAVATENEIHNEAGYLNKGPSGKLAWWYQQNSLYLKLLWSDYEWSVGFTGNPAHRVYELGIPMPRWNWASGDQIGFAIVVNKKGTENAVARYPAVLDVNNLGTWKDIYLATENYRPQYSNAKAVPSAIPNNGVNETILSVRVEDPDGNIDRVEIDLSAIGGGEEIPLVDNGSYGDAISGDNVFSGRTTVPTHVDPGEYELPFAAFDDHTPNIGASRGSIRLTVLQRNRPPRISEGAPGRLVLEEDRGPMYVDLRRIFEDPDPGDKMEFTMNASTEWREETVTELAEYRMMNNDTMRVEPLPDRFGNERISLSAKDRKGAAVAVPHRITVVVKGVNDPPRIERVNSTSIKRDEVHLQAYEDVWNKYVFEGSDPDNDSLTYSTDLKDKIPSLRPRRDLRFNPDNGTMLLRPTNEHVGLYSFRVKADDGMGGSDEVRVDLEVVNVNDAPRFEEISTEYVKQDEWLEVTPEVEDDDLRYGDELTFGTNITEEIDGLVSGINYHFDEESGKLSFKPDKYMVSTYNIYVEVWDSAGEKDRVAFEITVLNVNDPPSVNTFTYTGGRSSLTVALQAVGVEDPDGNELTYRWVFGDGKERIGVGLDSVNHTYEKEDAYVVTLYVSDGSGTALAERVIRVTEPDEEEKGQEEKYLFRATVVGGTGGGTARALVRVSSSNGTVLHSKRTAGDGVFEIRLPPGSYRISIIRKGYRTEEDTLDIRYGRVEKRYVLTPKNGEKEGTGAVSEFFGLHWLILVAAAVICILALLLVAVLITRKRRGKGAYPPSSPEVSEGVELPPADAEEKEAGDEAEKEAGDEAEKETGDEVEKETGDEVEKETKEDVERVKGYMIEVPPAKRYETTKGMSYVMMGLKFLSKDQRAKSLRAFDRAIANNPADPNPWYQKSIIYQELGEEKKAEKCFGKLVELDQGISSLVRDMTDTREETPELPGPRLALPELSQEEVEALPSLTAVASSSEGDRELKEEGGGQVSETIGEARKGGKGSREGRSKAGASSDLLLSGEGKAAEEEGGGARTDERGVGKHKGAGEGKGENADNGPKPSSESDGKEVVDGKDPEENGEKWKGRNSE